MNPTPIRVTRRTSRASRRCIRIGRRVRGGYLRSVCQRPIKGRNRVWAARWWDIPRVSGPTVVRLEVLWRSWEHLRQDATTGMSCGGVTTPTTTWRYSWIPTGLSPVPSPMLTRTLRVAAVAPARHRRQACSRTSAELGTSKIRRYSIYGTIMGAGVIVTVPLLIAVLLFQRRIVAGLNHWWPVVGSTPLHQLESEARSPRWPGLQRSPAGLRTRVGSVVDTQVTLG
jgi:hypothetical protein